MECGISALDGKKFMKFEYCPVGGVPGEDRSSQNEPILNFKRAGNYVTVARPRVKQGSVKVRILRKQ